MKLNNMLKIILLFRLIFGNYYKYSSSSCLNLITRFYCILVFIYNTALFIYLLIDSFSSGILYAGIFFSFSLYLESTINMLISFLTGEEHIIQFSENYFDISSVNGIPRDSYVSYILPFVLVIGRCINIFISDIKTNGALHYKLYSLPFLTICTSYLTSMYITDAYRRVVYCLNKSLKNNLSKDVSDNLKNNNLRHFIRVYVDLSKKFSLAFKYVRFQIALGLMFCWMKMINEIIYTLQYDVWDISQLPWHLDVFLHVTVTSLPFVIMEFAANDLEEIKVTLVNQLLLCKDNKYRLSLHDALGYIDVCMDRYTMWHKFPVNISTLLRCLNLCITFAIVILQFVF